MQPKLLLFFLFLVPSALIAQNSSPFIEITDTQGLDDILVDCDYPVDANRCFILEANYTIISETTSYEVTSIPFNNLTGLTNETIVNIDGDDKWSAALAIPFDFCFYTEGYNELLIGDNGIISFNSNAALADSPFFAGTIPNTSMPTNAIFGAYHDLTNDNNVFGCTDDPNTPQNECGEIKTYTTGTSPTRTFVISYENLNHFNCETSRSTSQIVLYEGSNIIEVYVAEKPINCETSPSALYRKNALIGIQNSDGTIAATPPNRNTSIWSASNEAWRFSPNGIPVTSVEWRDESNALISTGDQITICPEQSTNYTATVTYDMCVGPDIILNDNINIEIDLLYPVALDYETVVCDINNIGTEMIDLTSYEPNILGTQTGLGISYYNALADAQTETAAIANPNAYLLSNPTETIFVRLQRGIGCFDVGTLLFNLEEIATSQLSEIILCDTDNDNSEVIILSNYTNQIIGTQTGVNISYHLTQNEANDNTNPITNITASNGDSIFVRLTLQPESTCPNIEEITINLLPVPNVAPIEVTLCSNIAVYDLTQHESTVQTNNTEALNFSYHLHQSWALNNINPFNPLHTTNPIDPEFYVLNGISRIWVRTVTNSGCVEVFNIDFNYIEGVTVQNDTQVSSGTIFDLTTSITDMVADLTGITYQFYDSLIGAQTQNAINLISDPLNFSVTNPETEVFVVFTNTSSGCITIGDIQLESVSFNGAANGSFQVCDSSNDMEELVILNDYDEGLIIGYDNAQYMAVTYHILETEANTNTNPITEINITTPTTIYARIALVFEGAEIDFTVEEITLDFQSTILLTPVTDVICDEFYNNQEIHDLTQYETQITTAPGATFSYEYTNGSAINNPTIFNVIGPTQVINIFVTTPNGCITETTTTITFHPDITTATATIEACDADNNNEEAFNLNDALPDINANYTNYTNTFYPTLLEAQVGDPTTEILNPTTYSVNTNSSVYVRLFNATTTCYTTARINLSIIPVPEIISNEIIVCDFENDAIENNVDLTQFNSEILGNQTGVNLTYYNSLTNANSFTDPILTASITNLTTLYVNLEAADNCVITGDINFSLQAAPIVNNISVTVCDNFTDGEEYYNLILSNPDIISDPLNHNFRYFNSEINAINNSSPISSNYLITTVPQTIYVRVRNLATDCFSIAEIDLDFTFPVAVQDTELSECDDDFNLTEEFDLTMAIPDMLADTTGLDITYYSDEIGAQTANPSFLISTPQNHNTASETDNVFVRFDDVTRGCFSIGKVVLKALATPKLVDSNYSICDTDFDGLYTLNLNDLNPLIIQDQTGLVFTYYTNLADAENEDNAINNTSDYTIPNDNHTIYIHVINPFGCVSIATVNITIRSSATVEIPTDVLEVCDNDLNTYAFFDLTTFESQLTTEPNATFKYFNSENDAHLEQNEILNPTNHENVNPNSQTIFVRVSAPDKCDNITSFNIETIHITPPSLTEATFCAGSSVILDVGSNYVTYNWNTSENTQSIEVSSAGTYSITLIDSNGCTDTFNIVVTELPLPDVVSTAITECDYTGIADGFMEFNLNDYDNQLTNSNSNVTTHFYLSQADLNANVNEQNSTFTNTTNPQTLFVKIVDNTTQCYNSTTLIINSNYSVVSSNTYEICDTDFDGNYTFNLTELNSLVVSDVTDLNFQYYTSQTNAETQNESITGDYTIPNNNHSVFVRVENSFGCVYITSVLVSYRADAIVNNITDILKACDDDLDTFTAFDLTSFENMVSSETDAMYRYFNSEINAQLEQNEILNPTTYQNTIPNSQTIFVRVSAPDKCDNITSFGIETIHITPPTLTEATFCAGTSVILDVGSDYTTYNWSTSENTQSIEVSSAGTYSITLVDSNGCTDTFIIEVTELPLPEAYNLDVLLCDTYGTDDGFMYFNLNDYNDQLTGNNTNVTTYFFLSLDDLEAHSNAQNPTFINNSNPETLFVKIEDNTTLCYSIAELTLESSFIHSNTAMLELCDELNSENGLNTFDLALANPQVISGLPANTEVMYYETYTDAELQQNPLNSDYTNTEPYYQIIFSRVNNDFGCFSIEEVTLIVNPLPNIENDETVIYCLNSYPNTITLYGGIIGDSPSNYYYDWNTNENTSTIEINEIGIYSVTITDTDGCSKIRNITVVPSNSATIDRIDIVDATEINTITIHVLGEGHYEYALDDEYGLYQDSNIFTNIRGGLHTVYVRDKNECGIVSEIISVISIPKFFTPNNDTVNDYWIPNGMSRNFQRNTTLQIYNRYGKLLIQLDPFGSGWNGLYNGNLLPTSDYWYTLKFTEIFSEKHRVLQGHFTLKR
ncbi:T9SS type B sorting domain-containing protein [Winogradskyella sp. Asnod2-B02-A]|uniref:T9SS type B sorting domain-containing protein n=1 Tax=Winogradskyella sp. Asnod2-B02-A TaxID=3160583 RepID=UPI00386AEC96